MVKDCLSFYNSNIKAVQSGKAQGIQDALCCSLKEDGEKV